MNLKQYPRWINEFGVINALKISYWNLTRRHFKPIERCKKKNKLVRKVHSRTINKDIYFRPYSSDFELMIEFFWLDCLGGELEYRNDNLISLGEVENIIDAGANIGLFSILYSHYYPVAKIVAIEPDKENYEILKKNVQDNKNIYCLKNGLWEKKTILRVCQPDSKDDKWGCTVDEVKNNSRSDEDDTIEAITISDIIKDFDMNVCDILKMDIEGSEREVFSDINVMNWIRNVRVLIVETHERIFEGCDEPLKNVVAQIPHKFEKYGEDSVYFFNSSHICQ